MSSAYQQCCHGTEKPTFDNKDNARDDLVKLEVAQSNTGDVIMLYNWLEKDDTKKIQMTGPAV